MFNKKIHLFLISFCVVFSSLAQNPKVIKAKTIKEDPLFLKQFSSRVFALEPILGFQSHSLSFKGADDSNDLELSGNSGLTYGLAALTQFAWFFGGVEYTRGSFDLSEGGSPHISNSANISRRLLGLTFGAYINRKLRVGVTVYPYTKMGISDFSYSYSYEDSSFTLKTREVTESVDFYGSGVKMYLSAKVLKDLTVSLSYQYLSFQEEQGRQAFNGDQNPPFGATAGTFTNNINFTKFSAQSIYLYLSYPIEFNFLKNL